MVSKLEELTLLHNPLDALLPFIHRSSCTLTKLAIMCSPAPSSEIIPVLQALPSLRSFVYDKNNSRNHDEQEQVVLFSAMTLSGAPSNICPNLMSMVYVYWRWDSDASQDAFFAMARSRFQHNPSRSARLERVRVFFNGTHASFRSEAILLRMNTLQDDGFDAVFLGREERGLLAAEAFGLPSLLLKLAETMYVESFLSTSALGFVALEFCLLPRICTIIPTPAASKPVVIGIHNSKFSPSSSGSNAIERVDERSCATSTQSLAPFHRVANARAIVRSSDPVTSAVAREEISSPGIPTAGTGRFENDSVSMRRCNLLKAEVREIQTGKSGECDGGENAIESVGVAVEHEAFQMEVKN
ncbi:hypothetical protein B0H19DRAFT_1284333 [Mycena capillaripes]|nr:hypothetical protein B0H19DRAFT_1284333 [Mycena capillaripes]